MLPQFRTRGAVRTLFSLQQEAGGIASLPSDLTINGTTVSPTYWYEGRDATTSEWTARYGSGGTLTAAGSGGTAGLDSPTANADDRAFDCERTRYWAGGVDTWDGEDAVIEGVFYKDTGTVGLAQAIDNSVAHGWYFDISASVDFKIDDGTTAATISSAASATNSGWFHLMVFVDRSGSAQLYLNGVASGAAVDVSSVGSLLSSETFRLGNRFGTNEGSITDTIANFAMWRQDSWLDTHLQAAVARERYARAFGLYSPQATMQSNARASAAYLDKLSHVDGIQRLHYVGANAHRLVRRADKYNRTFSGYLSEAAATNLVLQSEDFSTTWTATNVTVSTNSTAAPNGETTADTLVENGTAAALHYVNAQASVVNTTQYCVSCFVKPINRTWFFFYHVEQGIGHFYDVSNGIVGSAYGGGFDDQGIEYWGNGWYRVWAVFTATATASRNFRYTVAEADNDFTFDGLSQDSLYVWGAQIEAGAVPSSYIPTTTGTVTRVADVSKYAIADLPKATFACDILVPDIDTTATGLIARIDDGTSSERHSFRVHTTDKLRYFLQDGGVTQSDIQASSPAGENISDGAWHEVRGTWQTNAIETFIDGISGGTDTSATIPTVNQIYLGTSGAAEQPNGVVSNPRIYSKPTTKFVTDFGDIMSYAGAYVSSAAAATLNASTYTALGGTFTEIEASEFTVSAAGLFTYTGTTTKRFLVATGLSLSADSAMDPVEIAVLKNGSVSTSSEAERKNPINDVGRMAINDLVELANGDTVQLAARADSGTPDLTAEKATITIAEVS